MLSLQEIFTQRIFRIPDYQRGYAWEEEQLKDLWQDIKNLYDNDRPHYMGMIGVEPLKPERYKNWGGVNLDIHKGRYVFYHIVDGQQRFLTLIVLLFNIIDNLEDNEKLLGDSKIHLLNKYIFRNDTNEDENLYIAGYEQDDPSHDFLINKIFKHPVRGDITNTAYTKNIAFAKRFFSTRIKEIVKYKIDNGIVEKLQNKNVSNNVISELLSLKDKAFTDKKDFINAVTKKIGNEAIEKYKNILTEICKTKNIEDLYKIITSRLKFDFNEFEEMEISMIFETMNKRGKPLSNLEMLKNRLIYLSSILDISTEQKQNLRTKISNTWKKVYYVLGRNEKNSLDDDVFLRNHWIMYYRFERREAEFHVNDIFKRLFTVEKLQSGNLTAMDIEKYRASIEKSIDEWFKISFPLHTYSLNEQSLDKEISLWLNKINILGFKAFKPLILTALVKEHNNLAIVELLKAIESHIFLLFFVSYRSSHTGTYHFFSLAKKFYDNEISIEQVTDDIKNAWTYGIKGNDGYIDLDNFYKYLKDLFIRENTKGFYNWKTGLKYLLYKYELFLTQDYDLDYNKLDVEHIFPDIDKFGHRPQNWENEFNKHLNTSQNTANNKFILCNSLGNLILVDKKNKATKEKLREMNFEDRKDIFYSQGLNNEQELCNYSNWTPQTIYKRGKKILEFMEKQWKINFDDWYIDKKKILFLDFLEIETFTENSNLEIDFPEDIGNDEFDDIDL